MTQIGLGFFYYYYFTVLGCGLQGSDKQKVGNECNSVDDVKSPRINDILCWKNTNFKKFTWMI